MLRQALITTLCLAVAILGVSGLHVHVPGPMASGSTHIHEEGADHHLDDGHAYAISALQGDHDAEHGEHGDIDIDPMAKAFTKLSLNQLLPAVALICVLIVLLARMPVAFASRRPADRPPRRKPLPHFLPPSHAPPAVAPFL